MSTTLEAAGERLLINDRLTYSEIPDNDPGVHGLLMNARFIQGIFDDGNGRERYARFGFARFDPDEHTDALSAALPEWYAYGLRAFTVGLQGGMPVLTIENESIDNNPFSQDGSSINEEYLRRLERLVAAADAAGMVVIVSILYQGQARRMAGERVVRAAVSTACRFLRELRRTNLIIEVANEQNVGDFRSHAIVFEPERIVELLELARKASGGLPVGCSSAGGAVFREIAAASDIILIHGNGCTRGALRRLFDQARAFDLHRPIVCNEDSPCVGQIAVAFEAGASWGYYNNLTKQEPPARWGVTTGEDLFFARRMARGLGIRVAPLLASDEYYFQGFEPAASWRGRRWLRLASEFPERIDFVEFIHEGKLLDVAYDEPFFLHQLTTWTAAPIDAESSGKGLWRARVHLRSGEVIERVNEIT